LLSDAGKKATGIDSAVILKDRQIRVFGAAGNRDSLLHLLAGPALAIRDGIDAGDNSGSGIRIGLPAGNLPIDLRLHTQGDARDALDRGADLIVSRDPALIEYAAARPEFEIFSLPWSRTYVLLQPGSAEPLNVVKTDADRRSLARDAVEGDARAALPPFWWDQTLACPVVQTIASQPAGDRIAYLQGDETARALAERLVAIAGPGTRTMALSASAVVAGLRAGSERAYIVALPRQTLEPCRDASDLPSGARIQPLIDSRAHAIVRKGAPPLSVEWDGTIRVVEP
jgi:hypothetical protein